MLTTRVFIATMARFVRKTPGAAMTRQSLSADLRTIGGTTATAERVRSGERGE